MTSIRNNPEYIEGGYIILARKLFLSELMDKPPLYFKLWAWMLDKAMWKDGDKLQRGQFVATTEEMQEAMSHKVGWRKKTPTKDEIRSAYEAFVKAAMITTTKTTRGMRITVLNYDLYQTPSNYEAHTEARNENSTRTVATPQDREEGLKKKKKKHQTNTLGECDRFFDKFWKAYPKKVKEVATKEAWDALNPDRELVGWMMGTLDWQKDEWECLDDGKRFIPDPDNWIKGRRWEDER